MTRIVGGSMSGRTLAVPPRGTRPTSERVREALFSTLNSMLIADGITWTSLVVLDLFAGSGALGLEALSRGAQRALLVERHRAAASTIRANVSALGVHGAEVLVADALAVSTLARLSGPFGLVLADPPYDTDPQRIAGLLDSLITAAAIAEPGLVVVEGSRHWQGSPLPASMAEVRQRDYGDTTLWYGRCT